MQSEEPREQAEQDAQLDSEARAKREEIELRADEALDKEFPPAWLPQKSKSGHPEKIVGLVLRINPKVGPSKVYRTYSAVVEVRATDAREWTVWMNQSGALYAQLLRLRIQPGEMVAIKYRGLKESEQNPGQSYHDFRLARVEDDETPAAPVDYDTLQRTETPALPAPEQEQQAEDDIPF
jgi:hypothetical protein